MSSVSVCRAKVLFVPPKGCALASICKANLDTASRPLFVALFATLAVSAVHWFVALPLRTRFRRVINIFVFGGTGTARNDSHVACCVFPPSSQKRLGEVVSSAAKLIKGMSLALRPPTRYTRCASSCESRSGGIGNGISKIVDVSFHRGSNICLFMNDHMI